MFEIDKEKIEKHPSISEVLVYDNQNLFPISWLSKQGFCEFQIYIDNFLKKKIERTEAMIEGHEEHKRLFNEFKEKAEIATFEEMLDMSSFKPVRSRELGVFSIKYGIRGSIDEIFMTPSDFTIIDDKPGTRAYLSNRNQVYGYSLAFSDMIRDYEDEREIIAALRERGSDNIFWENRFSNDVKKQIINRIQHIHGLINGVNNFQSSDNPNKCRSCRLKDECEMRMSR